jgi:Flp pilus assembly protein TadD
VAHAVTRRGARRALFGTAVAGALCSSLGGCGYLVVLHDPLSAREHNDLGVAYESSGQLDLAKREYQRALRLDSRYSQARVNLGNVEAAHGRWSEAETLYRRALRDSTTNADAMNNLAVALVRQNRHLDEARTLAESAVASGGARDSIYRATLAEVTAIKR